MDYLTTTAQFIALNFIFIICCIPIVTIGPALAALYQVIMRETRGEHGYLIRKYLQHFKEMFLQSFLTSILLGAIVLLLLFNVVFWNHMEGIIANIFIVLVYIMLLAAVCTVIYVFPLMARFKNGFFQTIKNAYYIALTNPIDTIKLLVIHALVITILYYFPSSQIFMLFVGFCFTIYCNSYVLLKVFKKYEDEADTDHTLETR
jgi:uncharacterized membrane protein YesL